MLYFARPPTAHTSYLTDPPPCWYHRSLPSATFANSLNPQVRLFPEHSSSPPSHSPDSQSSMVPQERQAASWFAQDLWAESNVSFFRKEGDGQ